MVYFFNLYIFFFFPVALQAYFALAKELRYRTGANSVCANKVNTSRAEDIPSSSVARTSGCFAQLEGERSSCNPFELFSYFQIPE